jgi:nucleoside-diphosphate-sugar epimerase
MASPFSSMSTLISGGFGFIGSYLTPHFIGRGGPVGVITRRVPPSFADVARRVDCYVHDLADGGPLRLARRYDCFVHLAGALRSAPTASGDPLTHALDVTRRCLDLCAANGISRFVHFSSFQVYGRDHGFVDESTPVCCRNDYARAHHLAEEEVRRAQREGRLEYVIVRPTNAYGFSAHTDVHRWELVPSCFCRSAVEQGEIVVRTSGLQRKDFVHLEQVASLTRGICESFEAFRNQVVNLASGSSQAVLAVANQVKEIYERIAGRACPVRVLAGDPPDAGPLVVSRAKTAGLPYAPSRDTSLTAEIEMTLSFLAA